MKKILSKRDRTFWEAYLETGNKSEAVRRAGIVCNSTSAYAQRGEVILRKLEPTLEETFLAMGLDDQLMGRKTLEGLEATKKVYTAYKGRITDERVDEDFIARSKYLEILAKLRGKLIDKKELTGKDGGDLILQIAPKSSSKGKNELDFDGDL